jgi:copper(I)-binding protein
MKTWLMLTALFVLMTITAAQCSITPTGQAGLPQIRVIDAWSQAAPGGSDSTVYMELLNKGNVADILLNVEADIGTAELYENKEESGVIRIGSIPYIEVPANASVRLESVGKYVKLINLKQDLAPGKKVNIILNFEQSGPMTVHVEVRQGDRDLGIDHTSIQGHPHNK